MAFDKEKMIDQLSELTVLELVDLVEGLKDKWGVEAAAAMPMMAAMPQGGGDAGGAEEQSEFTISIKDAGSSKLQVIKAVREVVSDLGLKEAKELVESKGVVKEGIGKEEADEIKGKLEAAGATVEVK